MKITGEIRRQNPEEIPKKSQGNSEENIRKSKSGESYARAASRNRWRAMGRSGFQQFAHKSRNISHLQLFHDKMSGDSQREAGYSGDYSDNLPVISLVIISALGGPRPSNAAELDCFQAQSVALWAHTATSKMPRAKRDTAATTKHSDHTMNSSGSQGAF